MNALEKQEEAIAKTAGTEEPIAYLTSEYPAPTHTFIRREIVQLRKDGLDILSYSIRKPVSGLDSPPDVEAQSETFYVLGQGVGTYLTAHIGALLRSPVRYMKTLGKALRHRVPGAKALLWSLFHFAESITLAAQLKKDRIAHLHNHFANSAANVGMLAASFNRIPWSLTLHGISETDYPAGLLLAEKVAAAKFVACVSWFGRAQAMRICGPSQWDKFHTVRCGIALDELPPETEPLRGGTTKDEPKQIICVARLSSEKGLPGLLKAFAGLRNKGQNIELSLVGDGPEQSLIEAECKKLGVDPFVNFLGRKSEAETLAAIARADVLVLPSFMEGLPVVLMEAMAQGVPVVASRIAGVPELVEDGVNGLLFHPADWNGLEKALADSLTQETRTKAMVLEAKKTIKRYFDIEIAVSPLPELFSDAIAGHRRSEVSADGQGEPV
ncbi:glycosyltransferase [Sphingorhabdus sp. Alg231-15]|uniref:glycosyltransferase n=1 Tax=Sphingorhabdus sp. Alg231-15 TaxID=1922222 RepID=UPI000D55605F